MGKNEHSSGSSADELPNSPATNRSRQKYSITLSPKSSEAFKWLREVTDADTDSEVVRNALRLHYVLLKHDIAGAKFYIQEEGQPPLYIDLFSDN